MLSISLLALILAVWALAVGSIVHNTCEKNKQAIADLTREYYKDKNTK